MKRRVHESRQTQSTATKRSASATSCQGSIHRDGEEGQIRIMAIALYQEFLDRIAESAWLMEQANKTKILEDSQGAESVELPGGTVTDYRRLCFACILFVKAYRSPLAWAINEVDTLCSNHGGDYKALFLALIRDSRLIDPVEPLRPPSPATDKAFSHSC